MRNKTLKIIILSIFLLFPNLSAKERKDWDISLGLGSLASPAYEGSDRYEFRVIPLINISWKDRLFLRNQGELGVNIIKTDNGFTFGTSVLPYFGRDENDDDNLKGLGDIKEGMQVKLFAKYRNGSYTASISYTDAVIFNSYRGYTLNMSAGYHYMFARKFFAGISAFTTYASGKYMQDIFGINAQQAASSNYLEYSPSGGIKDFGLNTISRIHLTKNWGILAYLIYKKLTGNAANSPIVKAGEDDQFVAVLGLCYKF